MSTVLEQKALCALRQYSLFSQGDRIAVGVSGGADSVALLRFLAALRPQFGWDLVVCHIHHGLRGAEADRDECFVRALADQLGLPCAVSRIDAAALALRDHISVEEAGRTARYAFFAQTAGEGGRIATAHTLDDSIETVLMNLVRGTGLRGLCGIPRIRGNIVRPLLDCTRAEVEDYLGALGQPYCTDSTNLTDDYTRNRIRHDILPRLCELNPNFPGAMARMLPRLAAQQALTDCLAAQSAQQLQAPGRGRSPGRPGGPAGAPGDPAGVPPHAPLPLPPPPPPGPPRPRASGGGPGRGFSALPEPVCDRLLLRLLEQNRLPVSAAAVERMTETLRTGGKLDLAARSWFFVAQGDLAAVIYAPPGGIPPVPVPLPQEETSVILPFSPQKSLKLTLCNKIVANTSEKFNISLLKYAIDCDRIKGYSFMRTRRPGDTFIIGKKQLSLGEAWAAAGIPALLRPALMVLADEQGVLWAEGIGSSSRAAVTENTKQYVIIECQEEKTP